MDPFHAVEVLFRIVVVSRVRVRVMVFNSTFNNIPVISWSKPEYPEKTTNLSQVSDKLVIRVVYVET